MALARKKKVCRPTTGKPGNGAKRRCLYAQPRAQRRRSQLFRRIHHRPLIGEGPRPVEPRNNFDQQQNQDSTEKNTTDHKQWDTKSTLRKSGLVDFQGVMGEYLRSKKGTAQSPRQKSDERGYLVVSGMRDSNLPI